MTVKTSWNKIDPNLVPSNIRDGEYIFGIWPWTVVPWGGIRPVTWVGQSRNLFNTITQMPQYMFPINYLETLVSWAWGFVLLWNNLCCVIGHNHHYTWADARNIDITTWAITFIGSMSDHQNPFTTFQAVITDWSKIWRRTRDSSWPTDFYYEIDIATWSISWPTPGLPTWSALPTTIVVWSNTFAISWLISGYWLRTGNSGNDQINRTGIVVT